MYTFQASRKSKKIKGYLRPYGFRKCRLDFIFGILVGIAITTFLTYFTEYSCSNVSMSAVDFEKNDTTRTDNEPTMDESDNQINLVSVVCGENRLPQFFTFAKLAIVFQNTSKLHFIVMAEYELFHKLHEQLMAWQKVTNNSFTYEIRNVTHTSDGKDIFPNLNRGLKCNVEKLYLPQLLKNVNKVLYSDTDIIFLSDLNDIWNHFKSMRNDQMLAGRKDFLDISATDVNTGFLLMDLRKMRKFGWSSEIANLSTETKYTLKKSDQELINIFLKRHPETKYLLPERFNYNPTDCQHVEGFCLDCAIQGLSTMHGWLGHFTRNQRADSKEFPFHFTYRKFSEYTLGSDPYENLFKSFMNDFKKLDPSICKTVMEIYLRKTKAFAFPELMKKK